MTTFPLHNLYMDNIKMCYF